MVKIYSLRTVIAIYAVVRIVMSKELYDDREFLEWDDGQLERNIGSYITGMVVVLSDNIVLGEN